jgi:hypothetical protein
MASISRLSLADEIGPVLGTTWTNAEVMQVTKSSGIFGGGSKKNAEPCLP